MSGAYFLLLMKMKEREAARRRAASKRNASNNDNSSRDYSTGVREPKFDEKLFAYVQDNYMLRSFFDKLKNYREYYNKRFHNGLCGELSQYCDEYYQVIEELNEIKSQLEASGLKITEDTHSIIPYIPYKHETEGRGFGGIGVYGYNVQHKVGTTFNGVEITPAIVCDVINPYEAEYNEWRNANPTIEDDIAKLSQAINGLELKYKKALFKSKDKLSEIDDFKVKLDSLYEVKKVGDDLRNRYRVIASLTDEQKELITRYYACIEKCLPYSDKMKEMINFVCSRDYEIKFETYDVLIDFGIKNGDLLLSEINMVAELLSPEKLVDLTEGIRSSPYEYGVDVVGFYGDYLGYDLEPEKSAKKL